MDDSRVSSKTFSGYLSSSRLGDLGEKKAASYLKKKKYRIVQRGFRFARGEIDIIAIKDQTLVFIEVKTKRDIRFGWPEEQVSKKKQLMIKRTAAGFLRNTHFIQLPCRFDVMSLVLKKDKKWKIQHFQDAFE